MWCAPHPFQAVWMCAVEAIEGERWCGGSKECSSSWKSQHPDWTGLVSVWCFIWIFTSPVLFCNPLCSYNKYVFLPLLCLSKYFHYKIKEEVVFSLNKINWCVLEISKLLGPCWETLCQSTRWKAKAVCTRGVLLFLLLTEEIPCFAVRVVQCLPQCRGKFSYSDSS